MSQCLRQGSNCVVIKTCAHQETSVDKKKTEEGNTLIFWQDITLFLVGKNLLTSERVRISTEIFLNLCNCCFTTFGVRGQLSTLLNRIPTKLYAALKH